MPAKNKKQNKKGRSRRTQVKVKVKTGSSGKKQSPLQQILGGALGGLAGYFGSRALGSNLGTGANLRSVDPQIKAIINDRSGRMSTVNKKTGT